jgi:tubulin-specific chaperone E
MEFPINSRVKINNSIGIVKYYGEVFIHLNNEIFPLSLIFYNNFQISMHSGNWVGVEWDNKDRGKHNGTIDGIKYFETR